MQSKELFIVRLPICSDAVHFCTDVYMKSACSRFCEAERHICTQVKGSAKDVGKNLDPSSSNLPNPSAAVDKAAGNAKGLAADAKQGAKNVASDLSENPLDGLADKVISLSSLCWHTLRRFLILSEFRAAGCCCPSHCQK